MGGFVLVLVSSQTMFQFSLHVYISSLQIMHARVSVAALQSLTQSVSCGMQTIFSSALCVLQCFLFPYIPLPHDAGRPVSRGIGIDSSVHVRGPHSPERFAWRFCTLHKKSRQVALYRICVFEMMGTAALSWF